MENMMETKDLMWAVWSLVLCVVSYKVGNFMGFSRGILVAKAAMGKMLHDGVLMVKGE